MVTEQLYWRKNICGCFRILCLWLVLPIMKRCTEQCALQMYRTSLRQLLVGFYTVQQGPLLFLIYINDLQIVFSKSVFHHFTDDTNLLFPTIYGCLVWSYSSQNNIDRIIKLQKTVHYRIITYSEFTEHTGLFFQSRFKPRLFGVHVFFAFFRN